jgi:hypothetical protein
MYLLETHLYMIDLVHCSMERLCRRPEAVGLGLKYRRHSLTRQQPSGYVESAYGGVSLGPNDVLALILRLLQAQHA